MCVKFKEPKIYHAKKSRWFIQKKVHQKRKRFIKHRNMREKGKDSKKEKLGVSFIH